MNTESDVLAEFIRNETGYGGAIHPDDDLLEAGILDSFNIVSLAMFAQERFGVEFEGEDLIRDNLASLARLVDLIRRRSATS